MYSWCYNEQKDVATALNYKKEEMCLTWAGAENQDVLIVQTPYQVKAVEYLDELCKAMNQTKEFLVGTYVKVKINEEMDFWVKFIKNTERMPRGKCSIRCEASSYAVFSFDRNGEECVIYKPKEQAMLKPYRDIAIQQFQVTVKKMMRTEKKFLKRKQEIFTGFYEIKFPEFNADYQSGDLYYYINGLEVPIVSEVLKQGIIYVKTTDAPMIKSRHHGIVVAVVNE